MNALRQDTDLLGGLVTALNASLGDALDHAEHDLGAAHLPALVPCADLHQQYPAIRPHLVDRVARVAGVIGVQVYHQDGMQHMLASLLEYVVVRRTTLPPEAR